MGAFSQQVFSIVQRIPRGTVATYGQVAKLMGRPRSARYVGYALHANPAPGAGADEVPCHRVVFRDGGLCQGYAFGGPQVQRALLEDEGVVFTDDGRVDLAACQWDGQGAGVVPAAFEDLPEGIDWAAEMGEG